MLHRVPQLLEVCAQHEQAELTTLHNAVIERMKAYQQHSTAANKKDWDAAKAGLAECVERLTGLYFPKQTTEPEGPTFKTKGHAFDWYKVQGGRLEKSAFYAKVPASGRTVARYHVSEMLRQERPTATDDGPVQSDLERRKLLADTRIAEAKAEREELAARKENRNWIAREVVFEREGALVGQIMNEARYHLGRAVPAVIHAARGDAGRAPEIKKLLEETLFDAFRALYQSGEVDQAFLDEEETA